MKTICIEKATYIEPYKVEILFSDKTIKTVDFGLFLVKNPHPVHDKYKDVKLFKEFKIESGNLVWGKDWDLIFPINQLYKGRISV